MPTTTPNCGGVAPGYLETRHPWPGEPPKEGVVRFVDDSGSITQEAKVNVCACTYDGEHRVFYVRASAHTNAVSQRARSLCPPHLRLLLLPVCLPNLM